MSNAISPMTFKETPPKDFSGMNLMMVFIKQTQEAKLFLKNFVDGWSIIVWNGKADETTRDICTRNGTAVIESNNDKLKLLCMYKIKYTMDIPLVEV